MAIKQLSRRHFLTSIGGGVLPIPFLSSLSSNTEAMSQTPLNFVSIRSIYGQIPELYYPGRPQNQLGTHIYHRDFSANEKISTIIGDSFKPVAHKLSLIRGVDNSWNGHNDYSMLAPSNKGANDGPSFGTSMDEMLARSSFYSATPPLRILRVAPFKKGFEYSWYQSNRQPYDDDMPALLNKLFKSSVTQQTSGGAENPDLAQALKAVDLAKPSYDTLKTNSALSRDDQQRVSDYFDLLTDLEDKLNSIKNISSCTEPEIDDSNKSAEHDAAIDLTIAALACGMTRIASLSMATFGARSGEGSTYFHEQSHWKFGRDPGTDIEGPWGEDYRVTTPGSGDESEYSRLYTFISDKVGSMMSKMDTVMQANGKSLLDNSIVFWGNELSGGYAHDGHSQPILVGGTANGQFKPGYWDYTFKNHHFYADRADIYPAVGTIPYRNFLVTLLHALGIQQNEWEEVNGEPGFGHFALLSQYIYRADGGHEMRARDIYADFNRDATAKRRTLPLWYTGS